MTNQRLKELLLSGAPRPDIVKEMMKDGISRRTAYRRIKDAIDGQQTPPQATDIDPETLKTADPEPATPRPETAPEPADIDPELLNDPEIQAIIQKKKEQAEKKRRELEEKKQREIQAKRKAGADGISVSGYYDTDLKMYIPDGDPADPAQLKIPAGYVKRPALFNTIDTAYKSGTGLKLSGPAGSGKSLAIMKYAIDNNIPIVKITCNPSEPLEKITYQQTAITDSAGHIKIVYIAGKLLQAVLLHPDRLIILLDEINKTPPEKSSLISQLSDSTAPGISTPYGLIPINDGQVIYGTLNEGAGYTSRFKESKEIKDRIPKKRIPEMEPKEKLKTIKAPADIEKNLLTVLDYGADMVHTGQAGENPITLRSLSQFIKLYKAGLSYRDAWELVISKFYSPGDREYDGLLQIIETTTPDTGKNQ